MDGVRSNAGVCHFSKERHGDPSCHVEGVVFVIVGERVYIKKFFIFFQVEFYH